MTGPAKSCKFAVNECDDLDLKKILVNMRLHGFPIMLYKAGSIPILDKFTPTSMNWSELYFADHAEPVDRVPQGAASVVSAAATLDTFPKAEPKLVPEIFGEMVA